MPHTSSMSQIQWWDVFVQVCENQSDMVSDYLHDLGSTAIVFHEQATLHASTAHDVVTPTNDATWTVLQGAFAADDMLAIRITALQAFLQQQATPEASPRLYCRPLRDDAYLTQWRHFFQPLQIEQRLLIRPPWDDTPIPSGMACLTLEPGMAFGTGSHPTTYLALTLLAQYDFSTPNTTLFDVGCGSGILSLAGVALGVHHALGVDTDVQAIRVAVDNATLNDLQHQTHFCHGSWEVTSDIFDVITANIYLGPLVNMIHALAQRLASQGTMILSGILAFQEEALRTALNTARLQVVQRLSNDNWVALAVRHNDATFHHEPRL